MTFSGVKEALDFYYNEDSLIPPSLSIRQVYVDRSIRHDTVRLDVCATIGIYVHRQSECSRRILELFFRHRLRDGDISRRLRCSNYQVKSERHKAIRRIESDLRAVGVLRSWKP
jgi:hypothetical protein